MKIHPFLSKLGNQPLSQIKHGNHENKFHTELKLGYFLSKNQRRECSRRQREKTKVKSLELRVENLNSSTMTGNGRQMVDLMQRRKVDVLSVQETSKDWSRVQTVRSRWGLEK